MNDLIWKKINESQYSLFNDNEGMIALLSYDEYHGCYNVVDGSHYTDRFEANSEEEAVWRATVNLNNYHNRIIGEHMKLRDHLPSLTELYDKAFNTVKE